VQPPPAPPATSLAIKAARGGSSLREDSMVKVLNKRADKIAVGAVYIGRPSKWGNPFVIGKDGTRDDVVAKYRAYLLRTPALQWSPRD
jgi:hypothetical protein